MRTEESSSLQIQRIKRALYLRMNGVVADQMKQKGLSYRINYGVGQLHLKQIAATLEPDSQLSQALWDEQIRETMILATMLMPVEHYQWSQCQQWLCEIQTVEISDYFSMHLLSRHPLAIEWLPAIVTADTIYAVPIVIHCLQRLFRHAPDADRVKLLAILDIVTHRVATSNSPRWVSQWLVLHYDLIDIALLSPTRVETIEAITPVSPLFAQAKQELRADFDLSIVEDPIKKN